MSSGPLAVRLKRCSGPRCDRGRNVLRLRGRCTPPEQAAMLWPTLSMSVQVVPITWCILGQPMAIMNGMFIGAESSQRDSATRADSRGDVRGYGWCCAGGDLAFSAPPHLLSAIPGAPAGRESSPRRRTGRLCNSRRPAAERLVHVLSGDRPASDGARLQRQCRRPLVSGAPGSRPQPGRLLGPAV